MWPSNGLFNFYYFSGKGWWCRTRGMVWRKGALVGEQSEAPELRNADSRLGSHFWRKGWGAMVWVALAAQTGTNVYFMWHYHCGNWKRDIYIFSISPGSETVYQLRFVLFLMCKFKFKMAKLSVSRTCTDLAFFLSCFFLFTVYPKLTIVVIKLKVFFLAKHFSFFLLRLSSSTLWTKLNIFTSAPQKDSRS